MRKCCHPVAKPLCSRCSTWVSMCLYLPMELALCSNVRSHRQAGKCLSMHPQLQLHLLVPSLNLNKWMHAPVTPIVASWGLFLRAKRGLFQQGLDREGRRAPQCQIGIRWGTGGVACVFCSTTSSLNRIWRCVAEVIATQRICNASLTPWDSLCSH